MKSITIKLDLSQNKYICPYCGTENYIQPHCETWCVTKGNFNRYPKDDTDRKAGCTAYNLVCSNEMCRRLMFVSISDFPSKINVNLYDTYKRYPDYIPLQIRSDYEEAAKIVELSPKAAATLLRRCLQGMIRDFWGIKEDSLYKEVSKLKDKVTDKQWESIDALRKIGNIGAHMEKDVDRIIDISFEEAIKLKAFVEFLLDQWYINRYKEDRFNLDLVSISNDKQEKRNS